MCCDIMAFCSLGFLVVYFCLSIVPAHFEDKRRAATRQNKLEKDLLPEGGADANNLTLEFENSRQ